MVLISGGFSSAARDASSPWDNIPPFPEDMRSGWWFDPKAVTDVQIADVNKEDYGIGYLQQVKPINPRNHCVTYATYFTRAAGNLTRGGNGEALWLFRMGQKVTSKYTDGTPLDGSHLKSFANGKFAYDDKWTKGTGWSIAANAATKTAGTASKLVSSAMTLRPNEQVKLKFDATVSAGSVTPKFAISADGSGTLSTGTAVTATTSRDSFVTVNGGYGDQYLVFDADATFSGSISNVEILTRDNSADGHCLIGPGTPVALPDDLAPTFPSNDLGVPHYGTGNNIEVVFDMYFPTGSTNWTRVVGNPSDWLFWQSSPVDNVGGAAAGTPPVVLNSHYINGELRWSYNLEGGNEGAVTSHDDGLTGYGDPIVENKWYRHRINFALSDNNTGYFHHSVNGEQIRTLTGIPLGWYHTNGLNTNRGYITLGSYIASWNDGVGGNDPIDDTTNVKIADGVLDFADLYMANVAIKVTPL